jgi:truncated hemoglobin YjbI
VHDEAIHGATLSIHGWLKRRLAPFVSNRTGAHELRGPASREKEKTARNTSEQRENYLHALARACEETAREPRVRALFFRLLLRAGDAFANCG